MKFRVLLAFVTMLVMLVAAFAIGSYRVYLDERLQVELALSSLGDVLMARIEMGHNLLTVARRHLAAEDSLLRVVQEDIRLLDQADTLKDIANANEKLALDSKALLKKLEGLDSVQQDARDLRYVTGLLPRGFEQSAQWADAKQYNAAAGAFNQRLHYTLNGKVASLLGVEDAELFGAEGGAR